MARRKRNSETLERAKRRFESFESLGLALDFGAGVTTQAYENVIEDLDTKLAAYNTALSTIDKLANDVKTAEKAVSEMSEKMLLGVGSRYGKTSSEYEMAGGARRGSRRRASNISSNPASVTN